MDIRASEISYALVPWQCVILVAELMSMVNSLVHFPAVRTCLSRMELHFIVRKA